MTGLGAGMAENSEELARATRAVLEWMGATPETAGAALGINSRTLVAMEQGIVPMRSLVIRFADGVRNRCESAQGVPEWWSDADAWLRVSGYPPRRDAIPMASRRTSVPLPADGDAPPTHSPRGGANASAGRVAAPPPPVDPQENVPAHEFYHPAYERQPWGEHSFVHVFWIKDGDERKVYHWTRRADWDYKAEATRLKQDLGRLTKSQFDRKYGRFRYQAR